MTKTKKLLLLAAALVALGVVVVLLQPGPPDSVCVAENAPSSGFVDDEKDCPISIESYERIADHDSSPKPFRIAGILMVLAGVALAVVAAVRGRRERPEPR